MLRKKQHYLQIAMNSTLTEAESIINQIPLDERIIVEAGTPLIKMYGATGIKSIKNYWERRIAGSFVASDVAKGTNGLKGDPSLLRIWLRFLVGKEPPERGKGSILSKTSFLAPYIVADLKCMDRGAREVEIAREGGANAATVLGNAPIETIDAFIRKCEEYGLDSMIDMMNVDFPLAVLRRLRKLPRVVVLHRGVDEETSNREKALPIYEIQRIKSSYNIMVSVAGGDTIQEVQSAIFNDADIVVVWRSFYKSSKDTADLAGEFLKEIR